MSVRPVSALALLFLAAASTALAQSNAVEVTLSSPPSPVGAGARATGVASAFIAVADDATAASWNPAGLIQLERPEVSAVGIGTYRVDRVGTLRETREDRTLIDEVGTDDVSSASLNFLSAALPFSWRGRNLVISANYQQEYSFERKLDLTTVTMRPERTLRSELSLDQYGAIYAFSPALAVELTPALSVGATFNYLFDGLGRSFAWRTDSWTRTDVERDEVPGFNRRSFENVRGVNGTFGLRWEAMEGLSLGAVVDLPFTARLSLHQTGTTSDGERRATRDEISMRFPLAYGFGIAFEPYDRLVVSLDVTHVHWEDFEIRDAAGRETLFSGQLASESQVDGVTTVRVGLEHLWLLQDLILALRGGAFYDPQPSAGSAQDYFGFTVGAGVTLPRVSIDAAYRLRFGLDVADSATFENVFAVDTGEIDVYQHAFYLSTVIYL